MAVTFMRRSSTLDKLLILRSASRAFVVTQAPPSVRMRAAALSKRPPLAHKTPDWTHAAAWSPNGSRKRWYRQDQECSYIAWTMVPQNTGRYPAPSDYLDMASVDACHDTPNTSDSGTWKFVTKALRFHRFLQIYAHVKLKLVDVKLLVQLPRINRWPKANNAKDSRLPTLWWIGKEGPNETLNEMAHSIAHDSQNLATKGFWHKVIGSKKWPQHSKQNGPQHVVRVPDGR